MIGRNRILCFAVAVGIGVAAYDLALTGCAPPPPSISGVDKKEQLKQSENSIRRTTGSGWILIAGNSQRNPIYMLLNSADGGRGELELQCSDHQLDVSFIPRGFSKAQYPSGFPIRLGFDSSPPLSEIWRASSDFRGAFSPAPRDLVQRLRDSYRLTVVYLSPSRSSNSVIFDVSGLSENLKPIAQSCGISN